MLIRRYSHREAALRCLVFLQFSFSPMVLADVAGDRDCPRAEAQGADGMRIEFRQYQFPDGSADLVLIPQSGSGTDIKRVTYGGNKTEGCHYKSVAIAPGGSENQWGWHLAWAGDQGIRYARMDGHVWVSSPSKRLSTANASEIQLQVNGLELRLMWHERQGDRTETYQAVSYDEGRSWESPQLLQPAD
jgi:hypothetical protein